MMTAPDDAVPIVQANLIELTAELRRTQRPQRIRSQDGGELVIVQAEDYDQMHEALEIANSLLQSMADIAAGRTISDDEAQALFKAKIQQAGSRVVG